MSRNDRVTFRANLTVRARKHTGKSGLLKISGAPNSAEIHYLTVAPGSHNAEVEGSSPSLTTNKSIVYAQHPRAQCSMCDFYVTCSVHAPSDASISVPISGAEQ
jgi:hypothetical protein